MCVALLEQAGANFARSDEAGVVHTGGDVVRRQGPAHRISLFHGTDSFRLHCSTTHHSLAAFDIRGVGAGSGSGWDLRSDGLFGDAAHARDGIADGAGRTHNGRSEVGGGPWDDIDGLWGRTGSGRVVGPRR